MDAGHVNTETVRFLFCLNSFNPCLNSPIADWCVRESSSGDSFKLSILISNYFVARTENDKLRSEIRDHIRSYLCLQDQTMQLTKRLTETEKNMHRARSEVFRLKVKIEEMVTSSNENMPTPSPIYTIPPTKIVENLQFVFEKKEEAAIPPEKPLKERVVLQAQLEPNASILSSSSVIVQEESSSIKVCQ